MELNIGITQENRNKIVEALGIILANETLLFQKTKTFHWNVTGPQFISYHKLFDEQAEKIEDVIDEVAERIRSLGSFTNGLHSFVLKTAEIKEESKLHIPALEMIKQLTSDHETIIRSLREKIEIASESGDEGTADFLTGIMELHEKEAWFLRAHLE